MRNTPLTGKFTRLIYTVAVAFVALSVSMEDASAKSRLLVYTAIPSDTLIGYLKELHKDHPGIEVQTVRDSTGIITARLLAEKDNPRADIVWGVAATSLMLAASEGLLLPYAPKLSDRVDAKFKDPSNPPLWVGMSAWIAVICYNTIESKKLNLPKPSSWKDLLNPVYKNHLVMPHPASSGTGYLDVTSWIRMFGEQPAWEYMDKLHVNMNRYTHSGSKPCRLAAKGELPIGISWGYRASKEKGKGAPIDIILPSEGIGWDLNAITIMRNTKDLDAAKTFVDWATSEKVYKMYNKDFPIIGIPEIAQSVPHYPTNARSKMIDKDFGWAANNRARILTEWENRYGSKAEPKKKK